MFNEYQVRLATYDDCKKIVQLVNDAYWDKQEPFLIDNAASRERVNLETLSNFMDDPSQNIFVLVNRADMILGVIILHIPHGQDYARCSLFAIDKKITGKRIGILLIEYAETYSLELGKRFMKIDVFTFATKLARYYQSLGYSLTGIKATFFHAECIKDKYRNEKEFYLEEMAKPLQTNKRL